MLQQNMLELILFTGSVYINNKNLTKHEICKIVAQKFNLFSHAHKYPLWLSRVVEFTIKDVEDGTFIHGSYSGVFFMPKE